MTSNENNAIVEGDDVGGHVRARLAPPTEQDDTEGHSRGRMQPEDDDTEGHHAGR